MTSDQARRMEDIPASSIRRVFEEVNVLQAQGRKVIPLHIGQPDFDTPEHIKAAAKQALDGGLTGYTSNRGLPQLRQALAEKLRRENGLTVDPDKQIIVTVGANEAILMATMAFVNPGDEVLVLSPTWLHYFYCVRMAGGIPVEVPLRASNNFLIDPDDIRRRITNRTRMLIVNTPHNPTGAVYPYAVLKEIAQIVEQHGLLLLSDEIYEKLIYGEAEHVSLAGFDNIADRTLTINGFSKAYAMTGWRLGYIISSPEHSSTLLRVHQYTTVCATSFAQAGAVAALIGSQEPLQSMVTEFDRRREALINAFAEMPGCTLVAPQGAFYAFPSIPPGRSSEAVAFDLLQQAGVAVVPGSAFGESGEGYLRIAYSCTLSDIHQGMTAMKTYFSQITAR